MAKVKDETQYDENTKVKAKQSLMKVMGFDETLADHIIETIQEGGVVLRERVWS